MGSSFVARGLLLEPRTLYLVEEEEEDTSSQSLSSQKVYRWSRGHCIWWKKKRILLPSLRKRCGRWRQQESGDKTLFVEGAKIDEDKREIILRVDPVIEVRLLL